MTKEELQAKRAVALSELKDIEVALCLDEHYIDIIEKENAELERLNSNQAESLRVTMLEEEKKDKRIAELEQQIEKMKRHCNCKHRDSEGYCEIKRTYLIDLSYDGCDKWELED